jgi:hypothetical protein
LDAHINQLCQDAIQRHASTQPLPGKER